MQRFFSWSKVGWAVFVSGTMSLGGCPATVPLSDAQMTRESTMPSTIPASQTESAEAAIANFPPQAVAYEICGDLAHWQRSSLAEQTTALAENPRYGASLTADPLSSLFDKFWQESLITFTTYGLSARTEPIYLSGVWTGIEAMSACYEGDRPAAINAGELGEIWLIGYEIVDFSWTGEAYQLTVEPRPAGLKFVQFERLESGEQLPILVQALDGRELTVASGDWLDN
ncbi:MAG: hypothetical protein AAF609_13800 [Cyanobacteria bacterium P01_C01_bin.120]